VIIVLEDLAAMSAAYRSETAIMNQKVWVQPAWT
jgi:hypothetical protein